MNKKAVLNDETGEWRTKNGIRIFIADKLTWHKKDYKKRAASVYQKGKQLLETNSSALDKLDWDNPTAVERIAVALSIRLGFKNPACHTVAGMIAAMFTHKGIPYEVHLGIAIPNKKVERMFRDVKDSNHVWIRNTKNDKIYEHFTGGSGSSYGHKSFHMIKLTRKEPRLKKGAK